MTLFGRRIAGGIFRLYLPSPRVIMGTISGDEIVH